MSNRIHVTQFPANTPCEDTFNVRQLNSNGDKVGYYGGVFDGHGGWQMAEFAKRNFHTILEEEIDQQRKDLVKGEVIDIKRAIETTFDRIENDFLEFSKTAFNNGFARAAYVGACALVAVVYGDMLYVANSGDCKACK